MSLRWIASAFVALIVLPSLAQAQTRWDKFQQKLDDFRPKGKWIQQFKNNSESTPPGSDKKTESRDESATLADESTPAAQQQPSRKIPAQNASRKSILNAAKDLPSDGVTLGIQIDPNFIPAQRLVVSEIDAGSPAALAGIRTGDQITSVGGIPTTSLKALDGVLASLNGGDQIAIELVRNRKPERVLVRFEKSPEPTETQGQLSVEPGAVLLPPPPEMLDQLPVESTSTGTGLRSVLAGENPSSSQNRFVPMYHPTNPSDSIARESRNAGSSASDKVSAANPEQLQRRIREQEQLIEQLQQRIQQLQDPGGQDDGVDTIVIDPNSN